MIIRTEGFRAGMFVYAMAFLLGILYLQQQLELPDRSVPGVMLFCVILLFIISGYFKRRQISSEKTRLITLTLSIIMLINIGYIYAFFYAERQLSYQLDESLSGINILLTGQISGIPDINAEVQRFEFDVENHSVLADEGSSDDKNTSLLSRKKWPQKIRLSWYYGKKVNAGETWQFLVRLKPPHGFINPGGFDYEGWLFQHGIGATGYIRQSSLNRLQQESSNGSISYIRQKISLLIDRAGHNLISNNHVGQNMGEVENTRAASSSLSLIKALAVGDKSAISKTQWQVLRATGTSHLMAISGLHIGLASLFGYLFVRRIVPGFIIKHIPAQHVALLFGMFLALMYALIAGLSIPTQRAIIMLFSLSVLMLFRRNGRPLDILGLALFLVLLIDPLAVLSAGFWFSFSAVAAIFISVTSELNQAEEQSQDVLLSHTFWRKMVRIVKHWVRLQLIISVFLLPLSLYMFQQVSLVSPLANLILIPYVSFLVVPLVLLAVIFSFVLPDSALWLFHLAAGLLDVIWPVLLYLARLPFSLWVQGDVGVVKLLLATAAILLMFFARNISQVVEINNLRQPHKKFSLWSVRVFSALLFLPLFISDSKDLKSTEFELVVLDVGQGSAAVVQTQNHVAVIDTGARFSDKFDAGSDVIRPYLLSQGVHFIDRLIISHGDADHIGGAQSLLDAFPGAHLSGQDLESLVINDHETQHKESCIEGLSWHWDGVDFEYLSPSSSLLLEKSEKRNNHSCVLRVSSSSGSALLTGDIEEKIEAWMIEKYGNRVKSDVLVVPHHGSKTSSSQAFIDQVDPELSVISAGYKNRYKLPAERVLKRYDDSNRTLLQTVDSGAISLRFSNDKYLKVERYREKSRKYWRHQNF